MVKRFKEQSAPKLLDVARRIVASASRHGGKMAMLTSEELDELRAAILGAEGK